MDKGWGLTLDSDHHPLVNNFFSNNKPSSSPSSARFRTNRDMLSAADSASVRMFQFPASDNNNNAPSPTPSDDNRVAVDEVDFFSDNKNRVAHHDDRNNKTTSAVHIKKENSLDDVRRRTGLGVNVRALN